MMVALVVALLLSPPPIDAPQCAAADAVGWLAVPKKAALQRRLAATPWKAWADALFAVGPPQAAAWLCALSAHAPRLQAVCPVMPCDTPVTHALADDADFLRQLAAATAAGDDVVGRLDLRRLSAHFFAQPGGASYEQGVRRLGLAQLQHASLTAVLADPHTWKAAVVLEGAAPSGVLAAVGPPRPPLLPASVPAAANFASMVVQPTKMWLTWEGAVAGIYPMQYSLARLQLDALEQTRGIRLDDALGSAPRLWTVYEAPAAHALGPVAILEIADSAAAAALFQDALAIVADVAPTWTYRAGELRKTKVKTLVLQRRGAAEPALCLAFFPGAIVAAFKMAALERHAGKNLSSAAAPFVWHGSSEPVLGFGRAQTAWLQGPLLPAKKLPGTTRWVWAAKNGGWRAEAVTEF